MKSDSLQVSVILYVRWRSGSECQHTR